MVLGLSVTYFPDLTPYVYGETDRDRLNVGWLDGDHGFPVGPVAPELRTALVHLLKFQVNETRGAHACVFCGRQQITFVDDEGYECMLGAAELHIDGNDGSSYASPSLIVHYVIGHNYSPPKSFCDAAIDYATFYGAFLKS